MDVQDFRCPECIVGLLEFEEREGEYACDECEAVFQEEEVLEEGLWEAVENSYEVNIVSDRTDSFETESHEHEELVEDARETGDWSVVEQYLDDHPEYREYFESL